MNDHESALKDQLVTSRITEIVLMVADIYCCFKDIAFSAKGSVAPEKISCAEIKLDILYKKLQSNSEQLRIEIVKELQHISDARAKKK